MLHPEIQPEFRKLYVKLADANPHMGHTELYSYTEMILRSALSADTAMFTAMYMTGGK